MDGVAALRSVLVTGEATTALVVGANIFAGAAPTGTPLPLIMLKSRSKNDLNIPSPGATRFVSQRVEVIVIARDYPSQKAVMRAVRRDAADRLNPPVAGITGVSIHTDSAGPEFYDPDYSGWGESQDFKVKYSETR